MNKTPFFHAFYYCLLLKIKRYQFTNEQYIQRNLNYEGQAADMTILLATFRISNIGGFSIRLINKTLIKFLKIQLYDALSEGCNLYTKCKKPLQLTNTLFLKQLKKVRGSNFFQVLCSRYLKTYCTGKKQIYTYIQHN